MSSRKKKQKQPSRPPVGVPDVILSVAPALAAFCLRTFVVPCTHADGSAAPCQMTHLVMTVVTVVLLALALMRLIGADRATKRSFDFLLVVGGIALALLPGVILPLCEDASMACHTLMQPFGRVAGVVIVLLALYCELTVDHEEPTGRKRRR